MSQNDEHPKTHEPSVTGKVDDLSSDTCMKSKSHQPVTDV